MSIDPACWDIKGVSYRYCNFKNLYNKAKNKIWKILGKLSKFGPNVKR